MLLAPWAGAMQNMHPGLGAGVAEHSRFFEERWQRLFRSLYPIGGVVYDGPRAAGTARQVRGYHNTIKGVDEHGRPYHALDPETFYWAHATFFMLTLIVADRFGPGLSEAEKRQLFDEHVRWWRLYGMTMRGPYRGVGPTSKRTGTAWPPRCWRTTGPPATCSTSATSRSRRRSRGFPISYGAQFEVRRRASPSGSRSGCSRGRCASGSAYSWTVRDERRLRRIGRLVHHAWRLVPFRYRYHPRAAGWEREAGLRAPDAPQVESPVRNSPLPDELDSPKHYVPPGA